MSTNQILRDHYDDPYHRGTCDSPSHFAELRCDETGCHLQVELNLDQNLVVEAWFDGVGCEICEGMASVLVEAVEGKQVLEFAQLLQSRLTELGGDSGDLNSYPCNELPQKVFHAAVMSPLNKTDDDLADSSGFGGPSLREEC